MLARSGACQALVNAGVTHPQEAWLDALARALGNPSGITLSGNARELLERAEQGVAIVEGRSHRVYAGEQLRHVRRERALVHPTVQEHPTHIVGAHPVTDERRGAFLDAHQGIVGEVPPSKTITNTRCTRRAESFSITGAVPAMNQAEETVRKSGATVWTISIRGTSATSSNREEVLNVVTRASGGMRLTAVEATGLEAMLKTIANSLLSQYTVSFTRAANAEVKSTQMETSTGGKVLLTPWMR